MASIAKRLDGQWRARYRDDAGKEHARHFGRKVDAQRWLDDVTAAIVTGQYVDPKAGRTTVAEYAKVWQAAQVGSPGTARIVDNAVRLHIVPRLGTTPLAAVRRGDAQALVKALSMTYAAGTVRNVYDVLARIMASAVDDRLIAATPCRRIVLPRIDDGEISPPAVEDILALAAAVPRRYRAVVVTLAGSGLRIGELLGLSVADVDFLRRTVRVERQRTQSGELTAPKTGKSVRTVPLGQVVIDELAAHLAAFPSAEWLFTVDGDEPLQYRSWKWIWRTAHAARQRAEVAAAAKQERKSVTFAAVGTHDLRHFYASALIAGGATVKQVQTVLGHASAMITLRTYAHLWPGDDDRTRAVMDSTLDVLRTARGLAATSGGIAAGQEA
ncbi:MAG TPA: site-specific integrase [Acidothermaceae bacterium]